MANPDSGPHTTEGDGDGQPPARVVQLEELEETVSDLVKKSLEGQRALGGPGQVQANRGKHEKG